MENKRNSRKLIDVDKFSTKQKVILAICFLLFIIAMLWISKQIFKKREFDYNNLNSSDLIESGYITNDRTVYWSLNEIISNILSSYKNAGEGDSIAPSDFYSALTEEYREYLGKSKYNKLINSFLEKFIINNSYTTTIKTTRIINEIYYMGNYRYICELSTSSNDVKAYIGIILNQTNSTYSIFYIE